MPSELQLDLDDDLDLFDGHETLSLYRHGSTVGLPLENCLRGPLRKTDYEMLSAAGITDTAVVFHVKANGFAGHMRNGDSLADISGARWRIRSAQWVTLRSRWRCLCSMEI